MMIRVFTDRNNLHYWPSFNSFEAAMKYIEANSGEFNNRETIAIIDFENLKTRYLIAEFTLQFREAFN